MFIRLILLFTVVPLVELALLIELGQKIGSLNAILIVILTGIAGASLAKTQGFGILNRIRTEISRNQLPAESLVDGILVLAGGLLLLTPGLLTDALGFSLLLPLTRKFYKKKVKTYFESKIDHGAIHVDYHVDDR